MFFFKDCETVEQVRAQYKDLAKQHHPDLGGDTETMQRLNTEYSFAIAKILKGEKLTQEEIDEAIILSEKHREALEKIMGLDGLVIELVGTWIWVSGNTYPNRKAIDAAGFEWAPLKRNGTSAQMNLKYAISERPFLWKKLRRSTAVKP